MIHSSEVSLQDVAHHYDELDQFYRDLWGTHLHHGLWETGDETKNEAVENLSYKVLSLLGEYKGKHILDIGCGYGGTSRLAAREGAGSVTGITLSPKQYEFARKNTHYSNVEFFLGDWLQNTISDHTFDGAYSIECFSHIINKKKFFDEVKRTLRPGSKFVMAAWLSGKNPSSFDKTFILEPICREGRLPSLCSEEEVIKLSHASGLKMIEHVDLSKKVQKTWSLSMGEMMSLFKSKEGLSYFLNSANKERSFAFSVMRILMGYRKGSFRYGLFVMET